MALQGAGDPRWVVRERDDGRNVNGWHWEDKDVSAWAASRLRELLTPSVCFAPTPSGISVALRKLDTVDGDATLYNRKGVLKVLYDLKVSGKWATSHTDEALRTTGEFKFELFDEEPDVVVSMDPKSMAVHQFKVLFSEKVAPVIQEQCRVFVREMHAGAGLALGDVRVGAALGTKAAPSETKVTDYARSGMTQQQQPSSTQSSSQTIKKKTKEAAKQTEETSQLVLRDSFRCTRQDMFLGLTERGRLEAITRARAVSEAREGGRLELLGGEACGHYVGLKDGEEVIMTWKLKSWGEEAADGDVVVRIIDDDEGGGTAVEVTIRGVPKAEMARTEGFWRVQIFQSMKVVMGWGGAGHLL